MDVEEKDEVKKVAPPVEESPKVTPVTESNNRNVKSLLKDWSDDDEDIEEDLKATTPVKIATASPVVSSAISKATSPPSSASKVPTDGRSSPIRCRNIPKKDRREIVFEEFEPKVAPHRTVDIVAAQPSTSPEKPVASLDVTEDPEPEPIVQKKKKAAIERLSQQVTSSESLQEERRQPPVEQEKSVESAVPPAAIQEPMEGTEPPSVSCFEFEEEGDTEGAKKNGERTETASNVEVVEEKIKAEEIEKKDQDLMAQIGNILSDTNDFVVKEASTESVFPLKAKLSDLSLPPKERGKRIFKSRNTEVESLSVATKEEEVVVKEEIKSSSESERVPEEEQKKEETEKEPQRSTKTETVEEEDQLMKEAVPITEAKEEKTEVNSPPVLPRKRKFEEQKSEEADDPNATIPTEESQESKIRRVSSPDPIEEALKEVCDEDKSQPVVAIVAEEQEAATEIQEEEIIEEKIVEEMMDTKVEEQMTVNLEDETDKPKIKDRSRTEAVVAEINGEIEKTHSPGPKETSPIKTNDLLSSKAGQKVQIVQRVRTQDGSELTETKVAKISGTDTTVLAVSISQAESAVTPVLEEEVTTATIVATEVEEKAVNGTSGHQVRVQGSENKKHN